MDHGAVYDELPMKYRAARQTTPCAVEHLWSLFEKVELDKNHRTPEEKEAEILFSMRENVPKREMERFSKTFCRMGDTSDSGLFRETDFLQESNPGERFVLLAAQNQTVNRSNEHKIGQIEGVKRFRFQLERGERQMAEDKNTETKDYPRQLILAPGCKIIVKQNINKKKGLINGAMGTSEEIGENSVKIRLSESNTVEELQPVDFKRTKKDGTSMYWSQLPLREAGALSELKIGMKKSLVEFLVNNPQMTVEAVSEWMRMYDLYTS